MVSSTMYRIINNAYVSKRYTLDQLHLLVVAHMLTKEQFKQITSVTFEVGEKGTD